MIDSANATNLCNTWETTRPSSTHSSNFSLSPPVPTDIMLMIIMITQYHFILFRIFTQQNFMIIIIMITELRSPLIIMMTFQWSWQLVKPNLSTEMEIANSISTPNLLIWVETNCLPLHLIPVNRRQNQMLATRKIQQQKYVTYVNYTNRLTHGHLQSHSISTSFLCSQRLNFNI